MDWRQVVRLAENRPEYTVQASAGLDHFPQVSGLPDFGPDHPLLVNVSIRADAPTDLESLEIACIRASSSEGTWSARPDVEVLDRGRAQRASAEGPQWPEGATIRVEAWLLLDGQRLTLAFPAEPLRRIP